MDPEWCMNMASNADIEDSDLADDENEIRRLDAALAEANIEVCNTIPDADTSHLSPTLHNTPSTLNAMLPHQVTAVQELRNVDVTLSLNNLYVEKIKSLERILAIRLRECRAKLQEIQTTVGFPEKIESFSFISCGRPYFRDQNNRPAPENEDAIMAKAQMYDFSLVASVPGWTMRDKNQFTQVMIQASIDARRQKCNDKINDLHKLPKNENTEREIARLKKERDGFSSKMPFSQLALPLDQDYDWNSLLCKLNKRHTPHEYRSLWRLYFHPSINKTDWKKSEHNNLQQLAATNGHQDWDNIARLLNTGRTGYQVFVYYRTNISNCFIGKKWADEEITYLKRLIDYFREGFYIPWGKIAAAMENRTKIQIYNKYLRLIEQRKGRFLPEEDSVILNCVQKFGTNFRRMTQYLPHRSMVQIRSRYQVLNKRRVSTVWTVEDDRKLIQIVTNQDDSNTSFSNATKFFPGRNRINIRSRYVTLVKWMKKHPNLDIEHAPRRGARRLNHGQATENLDKAIENLKNTLDTEVEVKRNHKKINRDSSETEIEDAIIATLVNEGINDMELKKSTFDVTTLPNDTVVPNNDINLINLRKCLIFLGARLNKELFNKSHFVEEYADLVNSGQDVNLYKVKSYSKKQTVKTIKFSESPDVWGKCILSPRNYVLPPNYATITGCNALMSHISAYSSYCNSVNINVLVRKNVILKEAMDLLLERFYTLFLWPMLLSNEGPSDFNNSKLHKMDSLYIRPPQLPPSSEVAVKLQTLNKYHNQEISEQIDLPDEANDKKKITIEITFQGNDDVNDNIKTALQ